MGISASAPGYRETGALHQIPLMLFLGSGASALSYEYSPFAGDAFEGMDPTLAEAQPGASHQVLHRARNQHLTCTGEPATRAPM